MLKAAFSLLAAIVLLQWQAPPLAAQGMCATCELPPGCRGVGNSKKNKPECTLPPAPIELQIESDIDFGRLLLVGDGVGRALIDVATGSKTVFGGLEDFGGISVQGRAVVTGQPLATVRVAFPGSITLSDGVRGNAELRDFVTDLPPLATLDATGHLTFNFSGTLYTSAEVAAGGNLRGRVPIRVAYD